MEKCLNKNSRGRYNTEARKTCHIKLLGGYYGQQKIIRITKQTIQL